MKDAIKMNKLKIIIIIILLSFSYHSVEAQTPDELRKFSEIQQALARDPSVWRFRGTDPNDNFFPVPEDPKQILARERKARLFQALETDPESEDDKNKIEVMKQYLDADSWEGSFYRVLALSGTKTNFFTGNYKLQSSAPSELGKIKDIYEQITSKVARYGKPSKERASSCLIEGVGECRHMASILQESLEDLGITSELVMSVTHVWVRVTLQDPRYAGATFDLDPTWYAQPIPLAPRSTNPMSQQWKNLMLAILPSPTVTPTPTITPTPTPTPTLTPSPTPSISITPDPTLSTQPTEGKTNKKNSSGSSYEDDYEPYGPAVLPR